MLRRNVAENRRPNISVVETLAGPAADPAVSFYRAPTHKFGMGSIGPQFGSPIVIPQRPLDDVFDELGLEKIDVVKLDIEGAEFGALRGLSRRLDGRGAPALVFEFTDWAEARIAGQTPGDSQRYLMSQGYRLFRIGHKRPLERPLTVGSAMILALPQGSTAYHLAAKVRA